MKELVQEMLQDGLINEVTSMYTTKIIFAAALLGKLFLMVDLFHNYLRSTLKSKGQVFFDISRVVKGGLIIFLIWMYYPFFGFIDYLIEALNRLTAVDLSEMAGNIKMGELDAIDAEKGLELLRERKILQADGSTVDIWDALSAMSFKKVVFLVVDGVTMVLCFIVGLAVQIFALVAHRILFTLGPLALAFSILPYFEQARLKWLGAFIQTLFVFTILNVLNVNVYGIVFLNLSADDSLMDSIDLTDLIARIGLNVSIFALYLSSFYLSGLIIGTGDTIGQAFNSSVTAASTVIQNAGSIAKRLTKIKMG